MIPDSRFDDYVAAVISHGQIRGRDTVTELIAIGAAESGLDNMAVGRNDLNGTPPSSEFYASLGLGWLQHDSGWLARDTAINNVVWSIELIRSSPMFSLDLVIQRPGFVLFQAPTKTYIDFTKWSVWPRKSYEFLGQAEAAYNRAVA